MVEGAEKRKHFKILILTRYYITINSISILILLF